MSVLQEQCGTFRADELMSLRIEGKAEVINGELIVTGPEMRKHNRICGNILNIFSSVCARNPALDCGGDNDGYLVATDPDWLFSPDASLHRRREGSDDTTWLEFTPELVVEVLSPSNSRSEMTMKRNRFFDPGCEQFWIFDPERRTAEFSFRDGRRITASAEDTLSCEGIAAGLQLDLSRIFTPEERSTPN